jgi:RimJ/RimL family protein N-acetyltransferase
VPTPYGESDARAFMQRRYGWIHHGTAAPFAVVSRSDQARLLGSISLMRFAWEHARAEVGYWLAPEARRQGHATRAVRLLSRWGFATLRLHRVELLAAIENPASQRVAERCGFIREALLRSYLRVKEGRLDMIAFGLLADELERTPGWG